MNRINTVILLCILVCGAILNVRGQSADSRSGKLVHTVFFKLKTEADVNKMVQSLKSLSKIEYIQKVEIGQYVDTGHPDLLSNHTIIVQMTFENQSNFKAYESHPIHLASIQDTKDLLAAPPIGYDYIVK